MSSVGKHTQPVSGFSPLNFGGCSLWLDATATSNFALTGSNVTAWYDKSPFSNHATSVSGGSPVLSNTAINGRPGVYFSNAPSIGGPLTLNNTGVAGFILARPLQTGLGRNSDQRIFSAADTGQGDYNSTFRFLVGVQQQQAEIRMYRTGNIIPAGRMNASNTYIISWNYDGTTHSFFLNGVPGEITPTVVSGGLPFSSSRYQLGNQVILTPEVYNGMIGEVIIYNDALLPAQRQAVEGYLAWKWGVAPALGSTFSPLTSLPSCAVWFDGADASAFTLSGSNITQWRDKAGSNVTSNIGTPVYVSNAVGGVPGVRLDVNSGFKISPMSNAANTTTVSIYGVVATSNSAQNNGRIFTAGRVADGQVNNDYSGGGNWTLFRYNTTTTLSFGHTDSYVYGSNTLSNDVPCLISAIFSGTTMTLWTNGSNQGSNSKSSTFTFDRLGIGKNTNPDAGTQFDAWAGSVGEFLIFYAAHTEAQRLQVESYLASKWNIPMRAPLHLVPTHPYTRTRPFLRDFFPTDAPGCALWLDAGDRSTLTLSASNTVTGWADKSGNRRPLTVNSAGTYSATGFNGRPTIQFTNGQYMTTSTAAVLTNSFTVFLVHQITGTGQGNLVFTTGSADSNIASLFRTDFNTYQIGQGNGNGGSTGNWYYTVQTNPLVESFTIRPVAPYWNQYLNGVRLVNPNIGGSSTAPYPNVGNSNVFIPGHLAAGNYIGNISEVLIFSNALSSPQRQLVENYLATKWGHRGYMQGPLAHPFRYGPSVGITPRSTPIGCSLWLDAADTTTLTLSGSNVTAWRDKSGLTTLTLCNTPPTYVSNQVQFNASARFMGSYTMTTQTTVFAVYSTTSTATNEWLLSTNGNEYGTIQAPVPLGAGGYADLALKTGGGEYYTTLTPQTGRRMYVVGFNGSNTAVWRNGSVATMAGTPANVTADGTIISVGAAYTGWAPWAGALSEMILFNTSLTTTERQQIEGYLAEKWGLRDSLLPPRHAYLTGAPSGFTPASIPSCLMWLDAADASTLTLSGSNVTAWRDKSREANHFTTLAGTPPTYSSNQVVFPSGGVMESAASIGLSFNTYAVIVFKLSTTAFAYMLSFLNISPGGYTGHYSIRADNGILVGTQSAPGNEADFGTANYFVNGTFNPSFGAATYSNSPVIVAAKNMSMTGTTKVRLSTAVGRPFIGSMYEVMLFNSPLTTSQRQQLEGYLAAKWGIPASLPSDHPSRSGTPSILPTDVLEGCSLWLDAADASSFTLSGSNVTTWADKSGNGRNFTRGGTADRLTRVTVNGSSVVYFNNDGVSSNAWLTGTLPFTSSSTFIQVLTPLSYSQGSSFYWAWALNAAGNYAPGFRSSNSGPDFQPYITYVGNNNNRIVVTYNTPYVSFTEFTGGGANTRYSINGNTPSTGTIASNTISPTTFHIGGDGLVAAPSIFGRFYLSELIVLSNTLTTIQRQQVEGYLAAKWGLSATLPVGHPYLSGPQTSITPATVPGLRLWLDAADASSYTLSGSNLTAITDKSPFAWALGTPTNFTVNSTKFNTTYPSFFATGTGQLGVNSNFILAQPLTVYFAGQATTANSSTFLFDGTTSDRVVIYQGATMFAGGSEFSATNITASTSSHVISAVYNGSSSSMRLNGTTTTGTVGSTGFGGIRVSGRNTGGDGYAGHICELLICSGAHTTAQRQQMEGYLAWKWGIPFRLPGGSTNTAALYKSLNVEFDPRSVGACGAWFDAADLTTVQFASGSNIARWLDKSGFQNHLATNSSNQGFWPTYTSNTLNGKPVVTFSNAGMLGPYAPTSPTQPQTMFVVARPSALSGNRVLVQCPTLYDQPQDNLGMAILLPSWASYNWMYSGFYGENNGVSNALTASTTRTDIIAGSWKPSSMTIAVNGTEYGFSSTTPGALGTKALTNSKMVIGGGWYYPENYYRDFYSGYIAEILIFPSFLSSADRQRIEGYLAWKWGVQSQLPALHPYSNASY